MDELVQLEGLGQGNEFFALALDILLIVAEEFFDGGGAGGWSTEATFLHRFGEGFIVDELTRVFHRAEQ